MRWSALPLALLAAVFGITACSSHESVAAVAAAGPEPIVLHLPVAPATTTTTTTTTTGAPAAPPASTTVATVLAAVPGHTAPNGPTTGTVPVSWYGYPSILPVIAQVGGWVDVRLAQRPDQSTAWIPATDVKLSTTPWYLVLSLATEHLQVYRSGQLLYDFPAGIGTTYYPTPAGHYFVAMTVPPPTPAYGAFVLATSDHSIAITNWEGMGDAIVGIHGPIDSYDDSLIGQTGARISHGCIRLHYAELAQLAGVLAGSPLDVNA